MKTDIKETKKKRPDIIGWDSYFLPALKSSRKWKTFVRCLIALTVTVVFWVDSKTAALLGLVPFFGSILAVLLPPSLPGSIFLVAIAIVIIGLLFGWGWGNAAMAAALHSRSATLLAQQEQQFKSSLNPNVSVSLQTQIAIYHGRFLDPRSSAVYGAFLFIGTFALGALRAYIPNLIILTTMASIVLDLITTIGPLIPTPQYTLARALLIPAGLYIAVALVSTVLIFPESLNRSWLSSVSDGFLTPTLDLLRLQDEVLGIKPSEHETWAETYAKAMEIRNKLLYDTNILLTQIGLIDLDFSVGRLGPADLRKIHVALKLLSYRVACIQSFQAFVNDWNTFNQKLKANPDCATHRFHIFYHQTWEREVSYGHDLDSLVPILASCSAPLRKACAEAIEEIVQWIEDCNGQRLLSIFKRETEATVTARHEKLSNALNVLRDALNEFKTVERIKLIKPYEKLFDPETLKLKEENTFVSRSLFTSFVFINILDGFAEELLKFIGVITEVDRQRRDTKFWFPGKVARVKEQLTGSEYKASTPLSLGVSEDLTNFGPHDEDLESTLVDDDASLPDKSLGKTEKVVNEKKRRRNPDAFPPKSIFGKFWVKLAAFARFFKSPQGIFALRYGILSVALWIPSVCESSAWFYYENKGLWALIMAQLALGVYAGDQIALFFFRLLGTLIGLLIGIVVWYIGSGSGKGNPYGIVVATVVFVAPFLFARVALPLERVALWLTIAVTAVFVIGFSWVNGHSFNLGNPGVGISVGWKRALLVIIGFAAAFVIMIFPKPMSSRVLVRKTLAASLSETGDIFATEIEAFLSEEALARSEKSDKEGTDPSILNGASKEDRMKRMGKRVLAIVSKLRELQPSLLFARFEPQLSGTWPDEEYQALFDIQTRNVGALVILINCFAILDPKWCSRLVHKTPHLNPNFLSDVFMAVSISANCLMQGKELPAHQPNLRDRLVYHAHKWRGTGAKSNRQQNDDASGDIVKESGETEDLHEPSSGIEAEELTLDVLLDEHLPAYATTIVALSALISRIDEATDIVRKLCGEATFKGYDILLQATIDHEKAIGGGVYHMTHI